MNLHQKPASNSTASLRTGICIRPATRPTCDPTTPPKFSERQSRTIAHRPLKRLVVLLIDDSVISPPPELANKQITSRYQIHPGRRVLIQRCLHDRQGFRFRVEIANPRCVPKQFRQFCSLFGPVCSRSPRCGPRYFTRSAKFEITAVRFMQIVGMVSAFDWPRRWRRFRR